MDSAQILKTYFGYDSFRSGQERIITDILQGRDVLTIMPTGAGKSICYQVPALMLPGITVVISPLISLMQDQVKALNAAGIHAAYINSSLTPTQINKALYLAATGRYKIIYVAPERLDTEEFLNFARAVDISMLTVDEAHCISQWGQDFRPSYMKIVDFIRELPKRPVVTAFTATATREVRDDILCILGLQQPDVVVTGFDRPNLFYRVEKSKGKTAFVLDYLREHPDESGIIYCSTRKNVDTLYESLGAHGIQAARYHAGMEQPERKASQEDFIYDRKPIMVATNAFGMGIDKSNVRFVIHYNMPQSMENYYQEAGRAGRDGANAQCLLLYSVQDVMINKFLLEKKEFEEMEPEAIEEVQRRDALRLRRMEDYCEGSGCLRNYILQYFGEKATEPCGNCGNCTGDFMEADLTDAAKWAINCVAETRGRFGENIVVGTLVGANRARLREVGADQYKSYGKLQNYREDVLKSLIAQLVKEQYLLQTQDQYRMLRMGNILPLKDPDTKVFVRLPAGTSITKEDARAAKRARKTRYAAADAAGGHIPVDDADQTGTEAEAFMHSAEKKSSKGYAKSGTKGKPTDELTADGFELFDVLRKLRLEIAREESMPPYIIFNDRTLIDMCVKMPLNEEEFLEVSGVGTNKLEKYGERFLQAIRDFVRNGDEG